MHVLISKFGKYIMVTRMHELMQVYYVFFFLYYFFFVIDDRLSIVLMWVVNGSKKLIGLYKLC